MPAVREGPASCTYSDWLRSSLREERLQSHLLDALHCGSQVHGDTGEGLGRGHLLLDALPLLHELAVIAGDFLYNIGGRALSVHLPSDAHS